MTTFYIIRHGQTEWNVKKLLQVQKDSPLTSEGLHQAKKIGQKLKHIHFDAIFSSDALRAHRTAEIIALEHKMIVKTKEALRERTFGDYEGKTFEKFQLDLKHLVEKYITSSDKEKMKFKFAENIESDDEVIQRVLLFIRETSIAYTNKNILLVSHGGVMRALLLHLGYGTFETLPRDAISNTALIVLNSDGTDFFIKYTEGVQLKT